MLEKKTLLFDYKNFLTSVPLLPGVYEMLDKNHKSLYIGKAKNLKHRLTSYFSGQQSIKTSSMITKLVDIKLTVTYSEKEALILEQNLIKQKKPPYNILLRDDKSYPFIIISTDKFPRIDSYRGSRKTTKGKLFGPYPSYQAVTKKLQIMQNLFKIRQCSNAFFRNRSRPCLQYQINKCKAPCVNLVTTTEYQHDVTNAANFLSGKNNKIIENLTKQIEKATKSLDFEQAVKIRDLLISVRELQEHQSVDKSSGNIDAIGYYQVSGLICFDVLFIREGQVIDHSSYSPKLGCKETKAEQLEAFLSQFYVALANNRNFPDEIIIPFPLESSETLTEVINSFAKKNVAIKYNVKSVRLQWLQLATHNAEVNIKSYISKEQYQQIRWQQLEQMLQTKNISRIECFDVSHSQGEATIASCVVFDCNGAVKADYRKFNIRDCTAGDDYQALSQAITRRYTNYEINLTPQVLLIDGGKGQLSVAQKIINDMDLNIMVLSIAKGANRKSGLETIFYNNKPLDIKNYAQAFLLLQEIRDESHRFAITGHRTQRRKLKTTSILENIAGIGHRRRSCILKHFGGYHGLLNATIDEIAKVKNISYQLAKTIYQNIHNI